MQTILALLSLIFVLGGMPEALAQTAVVGIDGLKGSIETSKKKLEVGDVTNEKEKVFIYIPAMIPEGAVGILLERVGVR